MIYHLRFDPAVDKLLHKMNPKISERIFRWLYKNLDNSENPRLLGKAMTGTHGKLWRYRIGDYRAIASIEDDICVVLVVKVGHRREVYKEK